ncbi:DEAD/DEAH box helicase family protein [Sphingobacterium sp. G1-14]|uniref:DEAD/DEAH box helicase family protein n=1 Tax=Sphingobacterium sp. G1-14 TaxID=2003121 RepID=UPI000B48D12F|nr:DEAD/DEAH box helicase family protein [Sphingobacterium sp. G1-14]
MLKNCDWSADRDYKTGSEDDPRQFYFEGLFNSSEFHLLLGYFSSSAIHLLAPGFAAFISKGGKMRMVINHLLSANDKEAFEKGQQNTVSNGLFDLDDIVGLADTLDEYNKHFFDCLAYLISTKRIEFTIIKPKEGRGIAHYKSGVFSDGSDYVGYKASCNFTWNGLSENLEELQAFLSWEEERSIKLINKQLQVIDSYFSQSNEDVEYLSADKIEVAIVDNFGSKDINELLIQEKELLTKKESLWLSPKTQKTIENFYNEIDQVKSAPKFPYKEGPREYQKNAFENWKNNEQKGLFAMATGTGKTITSLNCLLEIYKKTGYYKALILVPTITLVNQWENECKKFNFSSIIKVYSKANWKNDVAAILTREKLSEPKDISYILISTYASFVKENTFQELNKLPYQTLLIADECHNMGSGRLLKRLDEIVFKRRIGLSATPERQYDEDGNTKLFSFFNSEKGYTYEYSMREAIENKILCRYYYYPHLVRLTDSEMKDYMDLSIKISKYYNNNSETFSNNPILTALLLARKRIIHKAYNKITTFKRIINQEYSKKGTLKYTLVYVPEGNDPNDYFETDLFLENEEMGTDGDAVHLIDVFTGAVKDTGERVTTKQFISGTKDKELVLEQFANGEIDVLTSMKCLDEGVDVPRAELAIFCASTGNPRQFVQRRGRILRTHKDKEFSYIHDLVVIPQLNENSESYNMERNMLKSELARVKDFSLLSENSSYTLDVLLDIMNHYNLNLYNNE